MAAGSLRRVLLTCCPGDPAPSPRLCRFSTSHGARDQLREQDWVRAELPKDNHREELPQCTRGSGMRRAAGSQRWGLSPQPSPPRPPPLLRSPVTAQGWAAAEPVLAQTCPSASPTLQFISAELPPPPRAQLLSASPSHAWRFSGSWQSLALAPGE